MSKYLLFVLAVIPICLFGQEKVSDINAMGVYEPTNISRNVGFVQVEGIQYMLEERDSLVVSKFVDSVFHHLYTLPSFDCKIRSYYRIDPNRSLFEFRDHLYYRIYRDGIQVIDVTNGNVEFQFDLSTEGFSSITPREIHENRFYFRVGSNGLYIDYYLDLALSEVGQVNTSPYDQNSVQAGHKIARIESNNEVWILDALSAVDSMMYFSDVGIYSLSFSETDNSFVIIENDGKIIKIGNDLVVDKIECSLIDVEDLLAFRVVGEKMISVFVHETTTHLEDSIVIVDIGSCVLDESYLTGPIPSFVNPTFLSNENHDASFSIVGYRGYDQLDGPDQSLYFVIDHIENQSTQISDLSEIVSHTPFIKDSILYFVGINSSYWGSYEYLVKMDMVVKSYSIQHPKSGEFASSISVGYFEQDDIIQAVNYEYEDTKVWKMSLDNLFQEVQPLNFIYNIGIHWMDNLMVEQDRIYFSISHGLYSVDENSRLDISYGENRPKVVRTGYREIASYEDKIAVFSLDNKHPVFSVLNKSTGVVDSITDTSIEVSRAVAIGPYIFYNKSEDATSVKYLDLKSCSIQSFDGFSSFNNNDAVEGENTIFFHYDPFSDPEKLFLIDKNTNEFKEVDFSSEYYFNILPGTDDTYYTIGRGYPSETTRIHLVRRDGTVKLLYEGLGYFGTGNYARFKGSSASMISLFYDQEMHCITIEGENVSTFTLPYTYTYTPRNNVLKVKGDEMLFKTEEADGEHYWYYKLNETPIEIEYGAGKRRAFIDLTNDFALLLFHDQGSKVLSMAKFDTKTKELEITEEVSNDCGWIYDIVGSRINENEYLVRTYCDVGFEPWILNIEIGSMELISDFVPGSESSYPNNFVRFKEAIYFTMRDKYGSRQWYRMDVDFPNSIEKILPQESNTLKVLPSPASNFIRLNNDYKAIQIYSVAGQLVYQMQEYAADHSIPVDFLENGSYLIQATDSNNQMSQTTFVKIN